jgi:hypothetical protein
MTEAEKGRIANEAADRFEALDVASIPEEAWQDATPLHAIRAAYDEVEAAKTRLNEAVRAAHDAGLSWGLIGMTLGVTRQAARQRFGLTESRT